MDLMLFHEKNQIEKIKQLTNDPELQHKVHQFS